MHLRQSIKRDLPYIQAMAKQANFAYLGDMASATGTDGLTVACGDNDKPLGFIYAGLEGSGRLTIECVGTKDSESSQAVRKALIGAVLSSNWDRIVAYNCVKSDTDRDILNPLGFSIGYHTPEVLPENQFPGGLLASRHLCPFKVSYVLPEHPMFVGAVYDPVTKVDLTDKDLDNLAGVVAKTYLRVKETQPKADVVGVVDRLLADHMFADESIKALIRERVENMLGVKLSSVKKVASKEYVIWGIPEGQNEEALLLEAPGGKKITDRNEAAKFVNLLESKYKARKVRIQELDLSKELDWLGETGLKGKKAAITLDIEKGDEILRGKWQNQKEIVKKIGEDEYGSPTVNGKSILRVRLPKLYKKDAMTTLGATEPSSVETKEAPAYVIAVLADIFGNEYKFQKEKPKDIIKFFESFVEYVVPKKFPSITLTEEDKERLRYKVERNMGLRLAVKIDTTNEELLSKAKNIVLSYFKDRNLLEEPYGGIQHFGIELSDKEVYIKLEVMGDNYLVVIAVDKNNRRVFDKNNSFTNGNDFIDGIINYLKELQHKKLAVIKKEDTMVINNKMEFGKALRYFSKKMGFVDATIKTAGLDKDQTLVLLKDKNTPRESIIRDHIVSDWVINEREEFKKEQGFPYQSQVVKYIVEKNNLSLSEDEEDMLGSLVYNASNEALKRKDLAEGFKVYPAEELESMVGKTIEVKNEGLFGGGNIKGKLIKVKDSFGIQSPRMRKSYYPIGYETKIKVEGSVTAATEEGDYNYPLAYVVSKCYWNYKIALKDNKDLKLSDYVTTWFHTVFPSKFPGYVDKINIEDLIVGVERKHVAETADVDDTLDQTLEPLAEQFATLYKEPANKGKDIVQLFDSFAEGKVKGDMIDSLRKLVETKINRKLSSKGADMKKKADFLMDKKDLPEEGTKVEDIKIDEKNQIADVPFEGDKNIMQPLDKPEDFQQQSESPLEKDPAESEHPTDDLSLLEDLNFDSLTEDEIGLLAHDLDIPANVSELEDRQPEVTQFNNLQDSVGVVPEAPELNAQYKEQQKLAKAIGASRVIKLSDRKAGGPLDWFNQLHQVKAIKKTALDDNQGKLPTTNPTTFDRDGVYIIPAEEIPFYVSPHTKPSFAALIKDHIKKVAEDFKVQITPSSKKDKALDTGNEVEIFVGAGVLPTAETFNITNARFIYDCEVPEYKPIENSTLFCVMNAAEGQALEMVKKNSLAFLKDTRLKEKSVAKNQSEILTQEVAGQDRGRAPENVGAVPGDVVKMEQPQPSSEGERNTTHHGSFKRSILKKAAVGTGGTVSIDIHLKNAEDVGDYKASGVQRLIDALNEVEFDYHEDEDLYGNDTLELDSFTPNITVNLTVDEGDVADIAEEMQIWPEIEAVLSKVIQTKLYKSSVEGKFSNIQTEGNKATFIVVWKEDLSS
jgi:hypothetical protein